jgi:hypothetical protein
MVDVLQKDRISVFGPPSPKYVPSTSTGYTIFHHQHIEQAG